MELRPCLGQGASRRARVGRVRSLVNLEPAPVYTPVSLALTLSSEPCKVKTDVLSHADCPISRTPSLPRSRASDSPVSAASTPECPLVAARTAADYSCL